MKQHIKLYSVVTLLALLLSAWSVQTAKSAGSTDGGTPIDYNQATSPAATVGDISSSGVSTVGIPSLEERDRILNGVNLRPSIINDGSSPVNIAGPMPGTESGPAGSVNPSVPSIVNGHPVIVSPSPQSIISTSIQMIRDWFSTLLRSIFNS
jgi:hypothetical protein